MDSKILVCFLVICSLLLVCSQTTNSPKFSCFTYNGTEFDLEAASGYWYEVARAPDVEDTQCLNYSLPARPTEDNMVGLESEFISTANGKWEPGKDSAVIPWDDQSKNGIFNGFLGENIRLPVTFKLISIDNSTYAFLCGYMDIAPVQLFKIWTRKRELNTEQMNLIKQKFKEFGQDSELVWVEQSEQKCNSAMHSVRGILVALALPLISIIRSNI